MMMTVLVLTIGIIIFIVPLAEGDDDAFVRGYVYDEKTGSELEGVRVELWGDPTGNGTYTDALGHYMMGVPAGDYHVYGNLEEYQDHNDDITLGSSEILWHNFTIAPETAVIKGYVTEPDSRGPIEEVYVNIYDGDGGNGTETDASGFYEMYAPAGFWYLWANLDGYSSHNTQFDLDDYEEKWINFTLKPMRSMIKGYVTEEDSRGPIEGVRVSSYGAEGGNESETDATGYYEFWIFEGDFHFSVEMDGYYNYGEDIYVDFEETIWKNITLEEAPPENSLIKGFVTEYDNRGPPIEDASLNVWDLDQGGNATRTDSSGYYEMNISAGFWYMWANADGYAEGFTQFEIEDFEEMWLNFTLAELTALIKGFVSEDDRGPVEEARVNGNLDDVYHVGTETDSNGYYELWVPHGTIYFEVQKHGYDMYDEEIYLEEGWTVWRNVTIEMLPPETSRILGYVYGDDDRGAPIEGADIGFGNDEGGNGTQTDENGYYEMRARAGNYGFGASADGYAGYYDQITVGDYEDVWINITLKAENAAIMGYITDDSRAPVEGAQIILESQSLQMRYDNIWTDEFGYFEQYVVAGEWEAEIFMWEYFGLRETIKIEEEEEFWFNRTIEQATTVIIEGFLTEEDVRGDPIADVRINFNSERFGDGTTTDQDGYFMVMLASGFWYDIDLDMPGGTDPEEIYVDEENGWANITYIRPPPFDVTIMGYIEGYETRAPLENAFVGSMNFTNDADIGTQSDDTGYFEFEAWSGMGALFFMAQDHYAFFMVMDIPIGEFWYNITLFPIPEADATVSGHVVDADGDPVEDAQVLLANAQSGIPVGDGDGIPFPYMTFTDDEGYYEIDAPAGDWYLAVVTNNDDDEGGDGDTSPGIVQEVSLFEETTVNVTLPEPIADTNMLVTMSDWDNAEIMNHGVFSFDGPASTTRIQIDFMMGNRDGVVDAAEAAIFETFLEIMMMSDGDGDEGPGGPDMTNTTDEFMIDGIAFDFMQETFIQELSNLEGDITSSDLAMEQMTGNLESQSPIPAGDMHILLLNQSYPEDEDDEEDTPTFILPSGFILESFTATANISVEGIGTDTIVITFVGEPAEDTWEWITMIAMVPNVLPIVDAGIDQEVTVNDPVAFEANATDTDGTIVSYDWDFDMDDVFSVDQTSTTATANHAFTTPGTYNVTVRVTDDRGGMKEDTLIVVVKPVYVPMANLQIESVTLSLLDPTDGDTVKITVVLRNSGDANATAIKVRIFMDDNLKDLIDVVDVAANTTRTVTYDWTAVEGRHVFRINMTYDNGGDEITRSITVNGGGDSFIPGFGALIAVVAILAGAVIVAGKRKR